MIEIQVWGYECYVSNNRYVLSLKAGQEFFVMPLSFLFFFFYVFLSPPLRNMNLSSKLKPVFLLDQWGGCGSRDCLWSLRALGNRDSVAPTFPAVDSNMQEPELCYQQKEPWEPKKYWFV